MINFVVIERRNMTLSQRQLRGGLQRRERGGGGREREREREGGKEGGRREGGREEREMKTFHSRNETR